MQREGVASKRVGLKTHSSIPIKIHNDTFPLSLLLPHLRSNPQRAMSHLPIRPKPISILVDDGIRFLAYRGGVVGQGGVHLVPLVCGWMAVGGPCF